MRIGDKRFRGLLAALRLRDEKLVMEFAEKILGIVMPNDDAELVFLWAAGDDGAYASATLRQACAANFPKCFVRHRNAQFRSIE